MARQKSEQAKPAPLLGAKALEDQQARLEREAAALRANLRKRKEQVRAREAQTAPLPPEDPASS
jgi:hypothetical protein